MDSPQVREAEKLPSREDVAPASISFLTSHQLYNQVTIHVFGVARGGARGPEVPGAGMA